MQNEIISVTQKLIEFRTTQERRDEIFKSIKYIKEYFQDTKLNVKEFCYNDQPSLFISFNGKKSQDLILNGHIDVVEGFDSQFIPKLEAGRLYGRGTYDMKAALATMMVLMKNISSNSKDLLKVGLMVASDEEIGGAIVLKPCLGKDTLQNSQLLANQLGCMLKLNIKGTCKFN